MNAVRLPDANQRVVSAMRPRGALHLEDLFGTLDEWLHLQQQHECFFFLADWHAIAVDPARGDLRGEVTGTLIDWLAAGVDPTLATLFLQSRIPEVAELNVLLGMCTPITWLERNALPQPEPQEQAPPAATVDPGTGTGTGTGTTGNATIGQLNYPLLQCADILAYRPSHVCVAHEQASHVELCRDVARRFNHLFGRDADGEAKTRRALRSLGARSTELLQAHRRAYQEQGDETARKAGLRLIDDAARLTMGDHDRLVAFLEGGGRAVLSEPDTVVVAKPALPGTDGRAMSHEAGNTICVRDAPDVMRAKFRRMPTDPARVRRQDPGNPENCPVWRYHERLGDAATRQWADDGCRSARIGCTDCKLRAANTVLARTEPVAERATEYQRSPEKVRSILVDGSERAREIARDTLQSVRHAMRLE